MYQELIMKLQDQKTSKVLEYMLFNISSLVTLLMITEPFAICGSEETIVTALQLVQYLPQAIMLVAGPFLICLTYAERIPCKWKAVKFCFIGMLFTVSLVTSTHHGIPVLEEAFGSAEKQLILLPVMFYFSIAVGIMSVLRKKTNID